MRKEMISTAELVCCLAIVYLVSDEEASMEEGRA